MQLLALVRGVLRRRIPIASLLQLLPPSFELSHGRCRTPTAIFQPPPGAKEARRVGAQLVQRRLLRIHLNHVEPPTELDWVEGAQAAVAVGIVVSATHGDRLAVRVLEQIARAAGRAAISFEEGEQVALRTLRPIAAARRTAGGARRCCWWLPLGHTGRGFGVDIVAREQVVVVHLGVAVAHHDVSVALRALARRRCGWLRRIAPS